MQGMLDESESLVGGTVFDLSPMLRKGKMGSASMITGARGTWGRERETFLEAFCMGRSGRPVELDISLDQTLRSRSDKPFLLPGRIEAEPPSDSLYCMRPGLEPAPGDAPS